MSGVELYGGWARRSRCDALVEGERLQHEAVLGFRFRGRPSGEGGRLVAREKVEEEDEQREGGERVRRRGASSRHRSTLFSRFAAQSPPLPAHSLDRPSEANRTRGKVARNHNNFARIRQRELKFPQVSRAQSYSLHRLQSTNTIASSNERHRDTSGKNRFIRQFTIHRGKRKLRRRRRECAVAEPYRRWREERPFEDDGKMQSCRFIVACILEDPACVNRVSR